MSEPPLKRSKLDDCWNCKLPSRYTCPRCLMSSCSSKCSVAHKSRPEVPCSGQRDKTSYVPLNSFGYSQMMSDYAYLEGVGRETKQKARSIIQDKLGASELGIGHPNYKSPKEKRDIQTRIQLLRKNIWMAWMPEGMSRRKLNQTVWLPKHQSLRLSVELLDMSEAPVRKILVHQIDPTRALAEVWLSQTPEEDQVGHERCQDTTKTSKVFIFKSIASKDSCYELSDAMSLEESLQKIPFIEYPSIEVWDSESWSENKRFWTCLQPGSEQPVANTMLSDSKSMNAKSGASDANAIPVGVMRSRPMCKDTVVDLSHVNLPLTEAIRTDFADFAETHTQPDVTHPASDSHEVAVRSADIELNAVSNESTSQEPLHDEVVERVITDQGQSSILSHVATTAFGLVAYDSEENSE